MIFFGKNFLSLSFFPNNNVFIINKSTVKNLCNYYIDHGEDSESVFETDFNPPAPLQIIFNCKIYQFQNVYITKVQTTKLRFQKYFK